MRIAIVQAEGAVADTNIMLAVKRAGMESEMILWSAPSENLADFSGYILTDANTPGADLALQVIRAACHAGKPILAFRTGVLPLLQSGLLPGLENDEPCITLVPRVHQAARMQLFADYQLNAFTRHVKSNTTIAVEMIQPFEFDIRPALLAEMQRLGSTVFYYENDHSVAAISNKTGNVMAMLSNPFQGNEGDVILFSMRDYIKEGYVQRVTPMHYYPRCIIPGRS